MLEVEIVCGSAIGGILFAYYSLCRRQKELENQQKDCLMKLDPSERLKYLKDGVKAISSTVSPDPFLSSALRIVARKNLNDNEYFEVLKVMYPKLSSIEEWKEMCTSNILNRYNFKGQY